MSTSNKIICFFKAFKVKFKKSIKVVLCYADIKLAYNCN